MSQDLHIIAELSAKPEKLNELQTLLEGLIDPTRGEKGCIRYDLWQHQHEPTRFVLVEQWESESDLEAHLNAPHLMYAKKQFETLLAEPLELRFFNLIA